MPQKLTLAEFEYQSESIQQEIRGYEIEKLVLQRDIKANEVEAASWDKEKSLEGIRKSRLGYEAALLGNNISEQKKTQLEDQLAYEKALTLINRESLLTQGRGAILALKEAQQQLEDNSSLFELKYRQAADFSTLPLSGNGERS